MKECIGTKFFLDGDVIDCPAFKTEFLNEGISIYEVLRLTKNRLLFMEDHLDRLEISVKLAGLDAFHTWNELTGMITRLPAINDMSEGNVKIVYNYRKSIKNHSVVYFVSTKYPSRDDYKKGVTVITYPFTREDPNKKIWLPDFRAATDEIIRQKKIWEVLIVNRKDHVTEASRANLFFIKDEVVITAPVETVLAGVTRKHVINICREQNIPVLEKPIPKNTLGEYDTVFLTSTSSDVLPVARIDDHKFNVDNPLLKVLMKEFDELVEREATKSGT
jgi:branched-chain amino acid aminotransferase